MLDEWLDRLEQAPDEYEQLRLVSTLGDYPKVKPGIGQKANWAGASHDITQVRDRLKAVRELGARLAGAVTEQTARRLAWAIAQFTLAEARERQRAGRLEFHDLLVLAREVLRDPEHGWQVRSSLRERYTHLLLDEFQDTDPIQCDLAALLASSRSRTPATRPWDEIAGRAGASLRRRRPQAVDLPVPARRHRRVPARPRRVRRRAEAPHPQLPHACAPVIEFVNHVFSDLITAAPDSQPEYVALAARARARRRHGPAGDPPRRRSPRGQGARRRAPGGRGGRRRGRRRSPRSRDGWTVARRAPDGTESWEPCRLGDICILLPARTSLGQLEDALEAAGIPAAGGDVVVGLRHARDPRPARRAARGRRPHRRARARHRAALAGVRVRRRRPLHVRGRAPRPRGTIRRRLPESLPADHPVGRALQVLGAWHDARQWLAPERAARSHRPRAARARGRVRTRTSTRSLAPRALRRRPGPGVLRGRGRQPARLPPLGRPPERGGRARRRDRSPRDRRRRGAHPHHPRRQGPRVPDHHRLGHDDQGRGPARRRRAPLPARLRRLRAPGVGEGHHRGVRPLPAHRRADGLPREAAPALRRGHPRPRPSRDLGAPSRPRAARRAGPRGRTPSCCGPRHRVRRTGSRSPTTPTTHSQPTRSLAVDRRAPRLERVVDRARPRHSRSVRCRVRAPPLRSPRALADAGRRGGVRPTPAWPRSRAISSCHRGTRGATAPRSGAPCTRSSRPSISPPATASSRPRPRRPRPRACSGSRTSSSTLARSALATDVVRDAVSAAGTGARCTSRRQSTGRESSRDTSTWCSGRRRDWSCVDYKTDGWATDVDLDAKVARYRLQGASYALALAEATGEPVARCVFLFLAPTGAVARDVTDLVDAVDEVRALMREPSAVG